MLLWDCFYLDVIIYYLFIQSKSIKLKWVPLLVFTMTNIEKYSDKINVAFEKWLKGKNLLVEDFPTYIMIDTGIIYYHFNSEHDSAQISLNPNSLYEPRPSGMIDVYNIPFKDIDMDNGSSGGSALFCHPTSLISPYPRYRFLLL